MARASSIAFIITIADTPAGRAGAAASPPRSAPPLRAEVEPVAAMFSPVDLRRVHRRGPLPRFGTRQFPARSTSNPAFARINCGEPFVNLIDFERDYRGKKRPRLQIGPGSVRPAAVKMGKGRLPARCAAWHESRVADVKWLTLREARRPGLALWRKFHTRDGAKRHFAAGRVPAASRPES